MISKYFKAHELVPPNIYINFGESSFKFMNKELIMTIDMIKEKFNKGTMTINDYKWKGDRQFSGLRTTDSPDYSHTSQHSLGNAIDCIFSDYTAEEVRTYILANLNEFPYIKGIELDVSWLHIDCRNTLTLEKFSK